MVIKVSTCSHIFKCVSGRICDVLCLWSNVFILSIFADSKCD